MKIIEIQGEIEKSLYSVLDAALKSGGMQTIQAVNLVLNSVKEVEEPKTAG